MTAFGTTVTVCGVSSSGAVNFGDVTAGNALVVTCTSSETGRTSTTTVPVAGQTMGQLTVGRESDEARCPAVSMPRAPGEVRSRTSSGATRTVSPVACSNKLNATLSGPGGISNRMNGGS